MSIPTSHPFERSVLKVILSVGLTRAAVELYLNPADTSQMDLLLDVGYLVIFLYGFLFVSGKISHRLLIAGFYVPLSILLTLTLYDRGGITASTENNIYAGVLIFCTTLRGRTAAKLVLLLSLLTVISLFLVHQTSENISATQSYSSATFNFIFMSVGTILVIYYAKYVFDRRSRMLVATQVRLNELNQDIAMKADGLEQQNIELSKLNEYLEQRVDEQIQKLDRQKDAINQYVQVILEELLETHDKVKNSVPQSDGIGKYNEMVRESANRLADEMELLKDKIENAK